MTGIVNAERFALDIGSIVEKEIRPLYERQQRAIALDAFSRIQRKTPVDFGVARGGLVVGMNTIPGDRPNRRDPSGAQAMSAARSVILGTMPRGSAIYITNNEPHFAVLDKGGFVPPDPATDPESLEKRAARRSPKDRKRAQRVGGHEGAPLIAGGFSLQAPRGMVDVSIEELRVRWRLTRV